MSTRALASPATSLTVAVLLLVLLMTGGAAAPRQGSTSTEVTPTSKSITKAEGGIRLAEVPSSPRKRRAIQVLSDGCRYSDRGIPRCGVLLGAAYGSNDDPDHWERSMGQRLGVHRTYFASDEVGEAVQTARLDLQHHRIPWISFKLPLGWAQMAAGDGDEWARSVAQQLAELDGPVWIAFHHEPEGDGNIEDWTAMQERLGPIVRTTAPNVAFSVILTGWNQVHGTPQYSLPALWPDTKVDLVGFDVYNTYGVVKDGRRMMTTTHFERYFAKFEQFARTHDVAWGLGETGQTDLSAEMDPLFVQKLYDSVGRHGGVAVTYFNSTVNSIAPWRLQGAKATDFAVTLRGAPTL